MSIILYYYKTFGGVRGRVVNVIDFIQLVPHRCWFGLPPRTFDSFNEEAVQLFYRT